MATETRKSHVRRIESEDDEDVWVDVQRADVIQIESGTGLQYQRTFIKLFWADEENDEEHPTRKIVTKRLENPEDEDQFIDVPVIDRMMFQVGTDTVFKRFVNDPEKNKTRKLSVRRVYHTDTATNPNDDGGKDYRKIEDTEDQEQYVDVLMIEKYVTQKGSGPDWFTRYNKLHTEPIKEHSVAAPDDINPADLVYLDPFQNIINVQWGGDNVIIAAGYLVYIFTYTGDEDGWTSRGLVGTGLYDQIYLEEGLGNYLNPGTVYCATYSKAGKFFLYGGTFSELGGYVPIADGTTIIRTEDGINWETVISIASIGGVPHTCVRLLYNSIDQYVVACLAGAIGLDAVYSWQKSVDGRTWETVVDFVNPFQKLPSSLAEITHGSVTDEEDVTRKIWLRRVETDQVDVTGGIILFPISNSIDVAFNADGPWSTVSTGVGNAGIAGSFGVAASLWQIAIGAGVAVINGGTKLAATRNGTTWSVVFDAASLGIAPHITGVAYLDGKFLMSMVAGSSPAVQEVYESTDGHTWAVASTEPTNPDGANEGDPDAIHPHPYFLLSGRVPDPTV